MLQNKKSLATGGLVLAGLAAYAWYKYSRMSEQEKTDLVSDLKGRGQKLYDDYVPQNIKDMMGSKTGTASANTHFGDGSDYTA